MARAKKIGLDYFPMDVDMFNDIKIRKLIRRQGGKAITVYALLLCNIYKNGYYMLWDEELPFIISELSGYDEAYIQEVIKSCLSLGLIDQNMFEQEKILTSRGIQIRYKEIQKMSKRNANINEFSLISSEETDITSEEMPITSEEISITSEKMQQRKEKKRKGNKNKEKEIVCVSENSPHIAAAAATHTGNEKIKNSELECGINFESFRCFYNRKIAEYDSKLSPLKYISPVRKMLLVAITKSYSKRDIEMVVDKAAKSPRLNGRGNRSFVPEFNWIFQPENFLSILEGNFNAK